MTDSPTITIRHRLISVDQDMVGAWVEAEYGPRGRLYTAEVGIMARFIPAAADYTPLILRWDATGNDAGYEPVTVELTEESIRRRSFVEEIPPSYRQKMAEAIADAAPAIVRNLPADWYADLHKQRERAADELRATAQLFRQAATDLDKEADKVATAGQTIRQYLYADARRALVDEKEGRKR